MNQPNQRTRKEHEALLKQWVDEAIRREEALKVAQQDLADFYKGAAMDLEIKPATLKKLVKQLTVGEEAEDPALAALMAVLEHKEEIDG